MRLQPSKLSLSSVRFGGKPEANIFTAESTQLSCIWVVVKMFVPETDVNVAVVACRFMWQEETRPTDT